VLFALQGGVSAFAAAHFDSVWLLIAGFLGFLVLLFSGYWADYRKDSQQDTGITTETAAILTFFLGLLVIAGLQIVAVALAIVALAVLSQNTKLQAFRQRVRHFELEAALKLVIITFIVLPILPKQALDGYFSLPLGTIQSINQQDRRVSLELAHAQDFEEGETLLIYQDSGASLGSIEIASATPKQIVAAYENDSLARLEPGTEIRAEIGLRVLTVMLSALQPYMVWVIVILVSFISFIGYVLVKIFGSSAGIGLWSDRRRCDCLFCQQLATGGTHLGGLGGIQRVSGRDRQHLHEAVSGLHSGQPGTVQEPARGRAHYHRIRPDQPPPVLRLFRMAH
jgi:hypothetical protein